MSKVQILVSVIIPIYNMEQYLPECLGSVLAQDIDFLEVICVNDASEDKSLQIIQKYAASDDRVIVIDKGKNEGVSIARNTALEIAKGEYVAFMDPDDYYPNNHILSNLYSAARDNAVDICGGIGLMKLFPDGTVLTEKHSFDNHILAIPGLRYYKDFQFDYHFTCYLYKLDLIKKNHLIFPRYAAFEDPVFFVQAMMAAKKFYTIDKIVYCYRSIEKPFQSSIAKTIDILMGLQDNLKLSRQNNLSRLHYISACRLLDIGVSYARNDFKNAALLQTEYKSLIYELIHALALIDIDWLAQNGFSVTQNMIVDIFSEAIISTQKYNRILTWPRKIFRFIIPFSIRVRIHRLLLLGR